MADIATTRSICRMVSLGDQFHTDARTYRHSNGDVWLELTESIRAFDAEATRRIYALLKLAYGEGGE